MGKSRPNRFTSRPVWRDYLVAYVLMGVGFTLAAPGLAIRPVGYVMLAVGIVVFCLAAGWSIGMVILRKQR